MPDRFLVIDAVPRTLSGKKLEVLVKKILARVAPDAAVSLDAVRDPDALAPFLDLARAARAPWVEPRPVGEGSGPQAAGQRLLHAGALCAAGGCGAGRVRR